MLVFTLTPASNLLTRSHMVPAILLLQVSAVGAKVMGRAKPNWNHQEFSVCQSLYLLQLGNTEPSFPPLAYLISPTPLLPIKYDVLFIIYTSCFFCFTFRILKKFSLLKGHTI